MELYLGQIVMFAGNFAPRGYAFCNGQILSIAQNTALFSLLGTTYGGNGVTNFALPNLSGRMPIGVGQSPGTENVLLGQVGGSPNVTLTSSQLPIHNHTLATPVASTAAGTLQAATSGAMLAQSNQRDAQYIPAAEAGTPVSLAGATTTGLAGGSQSVPTMSPYQGIHFIIVVSGIFPSRN
ncbi:phage tail protein [Comamonas sp. SY3]|uniref:phage tail protein n=1 Tax=Comamonas sp. SY3 TaxID=3243601 RepID=UPI0035946EDA